MLFQRFAARRSIYRLSLLAGLCCSGCALLSIDGVVSQHAFKPTVDPALEKALDQEVWRTNPAWSVVELRADRAPELLTTRRWIFGSQDLDDQLEQISHGATENREGARNTAPSSDAVPAAVRSSTKTLGLDRELANAAQRRDLVGWNAAIVWARRDPRTAQSVAPLLESLVSEPSQVTDSPDEPSQATASGATNRSAMKRIWDARSTFDKSPASVTKISEEMRAAAAEAWCLVLAADEGSDFEQRLAPAGRLLVDDKLPAIVRAELFRGLASVIAPDRIPRLAEAMEASSPADSAVRRGAIEACLIHAHANRDSRHRRPLVGRYEPSLWPSSIENCRQDADKHVRAVFGRWSAVAGHPDAFAWLELQLRDSDVAVRQAALVSLGYVPTEAARDELREQSKRPEELVRAFAVRGLAKWGVRELVLATDDSSSIVRQTVAQMLAQFPGVEGSLLIEKLLHDANPQVQAAALDAIDSWPNEWAIRLMLDGLQHCSLKNRQKCFVQLQGRIPDIKKFPIGGPHEERVAAANALAAEFDAVGGYLDQVQRAGLASIPRTDVSREKEVRGWLGDVMRTPAGSPIHTVAKDQLLRLAPADVSLIEKLLLEQRVENHQFLFYELLPRLCPKYAALVQLENSDVFVRRKGAQTLAQTAEGATLSPLIARRLHDLLAQEQDEPVWRSVASAFLHDASEESAQLALLAINHRWPDIRILGCQYAARHGRPEHGMWVLPLLDDPNQRVQLAAVDAAGRCHNPLLIEGTHRPGETDTHPGLISLLSHTNPRISRAAAVSLSRLGDSRGMQELVRMSYHESPTVRRDVALEMGATGRTRFVEHLIRMGHTEKNTQVQKAILEGLDQLVPRENRPVGLGEASDFGERVTRWVAWSQQQTQIR